MELTEKQFCDVYSNYYGEKVDNIRQIQLNRSNGIEMFEFAQEIIKLFAMPYVRELLINFCEVYATGQFEDPDDIEGIVDWYLNVKDN